jgi:heptaprenyl diphosphate synthase
MLRRPGDVARLGLLASAAVVLFVFESLAPRPLPWMKLGLGNLPVLVALLSFGSGPALAVSAIKLFVGGLLSGGFAGPAFVIGGGAGLVSWVVMVAVRRLCGGLFGVVGLSIWGALAHQLAQLVLAYAYIGQLGLFALVPLSLFSALLSGGLIGLLAYWTLDQLRKVGWLAEGPNPLSRN